MSLRKNTESWRGTELRRLRKERGLTRDQLAEATSYSARQLARWEKGEIEMPGPEEKLLRATFLASLLTDSELNTLRELLNKTLIELDSIDQADAPDAQFQFGDEWKEKCPAIAA